MTGWPFGRRSRDRATVAAAWLTFVAGMALSLPRPAAAQSVPVPSLDVGTLPSAPSGSVRRLLYPVRQYGRIAWLPALSAGTLTGDCGATVSILSTSAEPAKAVILWFGAAGACSPKCAGPMAVTCTGLIRPGGTWHVAAESGVGTVGSAAVVLFVDRRMSELDPGLGFPDMSVADYICGYLRSVVIGKCDPFRRFVKAVTEGLDYTDAGLSMNSAASRGRPVVTVTRDCSQPGGSSGLASYIAPEWEDLGAYDPVAQGYGYRVGLPATAAGQRLSIHVQNASINCSPIDMWFLGEDGCMPARWCASLVLAPGDSQVVDVTDCAGARGLGQMRLLSGSQLAVVAEASGPGSSDTLLASAESDWAYVHAQPSDAELAWLGDQTLFGPIAARGWQGWETVVHVGNLSSAASAKVRLSLRSDSGSVLRTLVDWLCPGGGRTYDLSAISGVPTGWLGSVRVDSLTLPVPGAFGAPGIAGWVTLSRPGTGVATVELTPIRRVFPWVEGVPTFPTSSNVAWNGTGALAMPILPGEQQLVAVQNVTPGMGYADLGAYVFDQNGLTAVYCHRLDAGHTLRLSPAILAPAGASFHGSLLISANAWHHVLPGATTAPGLAFIGLTASTLAWSASDGRDHAMAATGVARDHVAGPWSFTSVSALGWLPPSCAPDGG
jgi:hypothetical protein